MRMFAATASNPGPKSLRQQAQSTSAIGTATSLKADFLSRAGQWAASVVPSLGAILGVRLAATCETAGVEPPVAPPQLLCQKCESILQRGRNCSVSAKSKGSVYHCNYCGYRTVKTSVKKKTVKAGATNKKSSSGSPSVAGPAQATPSTGKKRKRKGWASLKDLATASVIQSSQSSQTELTCAPRSQKKSIMSTSYETDKSVVGSSKLSLNGRTGSLSSDEKQVLSNELGATTAIDDNLNLEATPVREEPPELLSSHLLSDDTTPETVVKASDGISSLLRDLDKTKEQTFETSSIVEANFKLPALRKAVHIDSTGGILTPSQASNMQSAADSGLARLTIEGSEGPAETENVACTEIISSEALPELVMSTQETTTVKETVTECEKLEVRTECKDLETAPKPEMQESVCKSQMQETLTETEMVEATTNCDKLKTVSECKAQESTMELEYELQEATTEPEPVGPTACEVLETRIECDVEQVATECERPLADSTVSEDQTVHVSQHLENSAVVISAGQDAEKSTADIGPELLVSEAKQMDTDAVDHRSPVVPQQANVPPPRLKDIVRSFLHAKRLQSARHDLYLGVVKRQFKVVGARCRSLKKQKLQMTKLAMSEKRRADDLTIKLHHSTQNLLRSKKVAVASLHTQIAHLRRQLSFLPKLKKNMNQLSGEMAQLCGELRKVIEALEQAKNHAHGVTGAATGTDTGNEAEVERAPGVDLDKQASATDQAAPVPTAEATAVETAPKMEATNKALGVSSLSKNIKKKGLRASVGCGIIPIKGRMMLSKIGRRWMISGDH